MPRMTGPNATKIIRTKLGYQGMIVALTGSLLDDDVEEFKLSGITSLIPKPIQQSDIEKILRGFSLFIIIYSLFVFHSIIVSIFRYLYKFFIIFLFKVS